MNNARRRQKELRAVETHKAQTVAILPEADRRHEPAVLEKSNNFSRIHDLH
jgi:hypothetical protein